MHFELSFSRRKALECPYSFQKLYGTGETTASQLDATAGIMGHELIAEYIAHLIMCNRQRDTDWLINKCNAVLEGQNEYIREFLELPIARFMGAYVHNRSAQHFLEQEFWATADGELLEPLSPGAPLPCDCYHGRADHVEVEYDGTKATIRDHKLGWDRSYLGLDCQSNEQIMGYCWLWLIQHPECKTVVGAIQPWRFTTVPIYGSWSREHLLDIMPQILAPDFAKLRKLYDEFGTHDWPAKPHYDKCCRWCMLSCPLYEGETND